jgi:hypothetical protein
MTSDIPLELSIFLPLMCVVEPGFGQNLFALTGGCVSNHPCEKAIQLKTLTADYGLALV